MALNFVAAWQTPSATHRLIIESLFRQRLTLRVTSLIETIIFSMALVVASERVNVTGRPSLRTVSVSSRPSRITAAASGSPLFSSHETRA